MTSATRPARPGDAGQGAKGVDDRCDGPGAPAPVTLGRFRKREDESGEQSDEGL
ncbi:MAG: hypothetical protein ACFB3T_09250 [Geminicoccaceae bacterium]